MPRVKGGTVTRQRHKKVLELTKGQRASYHKLYRRAHQGMMHALDYAYRHRKEGRGDIRRLWIARINAAARASGMTYSEFIAKLGASGIAINRKMLAEMAVKDEAGFAKLVASVKGS